MALRLVGAALGRPLDTGVSGAVVGVLVLTLVVGVLALVVLVLTLVVGVLALVVGVLALVVGAQVSGVLALGVSAGLLAVLALAVAGLGADRRAVVGTGLGRASEVRDRRALALAVLGLAACDGGESGAPASPTRGSEGGGGNGGGSSGGSLSTRKFRIVVVTVTPPDGGRISDNLAKARACRDTSASRTPERKS